MARVTVEDCIERIPNRFDLVILAAQRAKQIAGGNPITVERDNDKNGVVALREVADATIDLENLREETIQTYCKRQLHDMAARGEEAAEDTLHIPASRPGEGVKSALSDDEEDMEIDLADLEGDEDEESSAALDSEAEANLSFDEENINPED